jgi:hypothetical protein
VANIDKRNIFRGTTGVAGITDITQTQKTELIHVTGISGGDLSEAIATVLSEANGSITLAGRSAPLARISGRMTSKDKALIQAHYSANTKTYGGGTEPTLEMDVGSESVQWINTPVTPAAATSSPGDSSRNAWEVAFTTANSPVYENGQVKEINNAFDSNTGMPNGAANVNAAGKITPRTVSFPVVHIRMGMVLDRNPLLDMTSSGGSKLVDAMKNQINSDVVDWPQEGIKFPPYTLRFNGAKIRKRGNKWHVFYSFTHRKGIWLEQYLVAVPDKPVWDENDELEEDDDGKPIKARGTGIATALKYSATTFSKKFPWDNS